MHYTLETIRELANLQVEDIFNSLNIQYRERYHSLTGPCPIHCGDNQGAFSFHVERGIWKCFSRGCDEKFGGDIFGLIRGMRECEFKEAVEYVKQFINLEMSHEDVKRLKDSKSNKDYILSIEKREEQTKYHWSCLKKLAWHDYLVERRGYPRWLVEEYHIGACLTPNLYMSGRVVFPAVNLSGEIVGFTGRTLDDGWKEKKIPKWKHSKGSWTSHNVFNEYRAAASIKQSGVAILCEGPLDVLRFEQAGVRNSLGIFGKQLSNEQMTAMMNLGATKVILALDNDTAGKIGAARSMKLASCLFDVEQKELPSHRKDVGEMTVEEIRSVFCEI